ncbi:ParA family protein [Nocardiopsis alba]|uniref:ParA family protein n=1 Tax=Nocardiopsis alba TaxID=53437 RepID=UPI00367197F9
MTKPKIVALANHKGGVGKTTTTVNTAAALAVLGFRVLVIDTDPQANATLALNPVVGDYTLAEVLTVDETTRETVPGSAAAAIVPAGQAWPEGLFVLPGSIASAAREAEQWEVREYRLSRACEGALDDFDYVLLDLPPSLAQLTINGLVMADEVWVVTAPSLFSSKGIELLLATIERVQRYHNADLVVSTMIVNEYEANRTESQFRLGEVQETYPGLVYDPPCPRMAVIDKAGGAQHPLTAYGAEGRGAAEWYTTLARTKLVEAA